MVVRMWSCDDGCRSSMMNIQPYRGACLGSRAAMMMPPIRRAIPHVCCVGYVGRWEIRNGFDLAAKLLAAIVNTRGAWTEAPWSTIAHAQPTRHTRGAISLPATISKPTRRRMQPESVQVHTRAASKHRLASCLSPTQPSEPTSLAAARPTHHRVSSP